MINLLSSNIYNYKIIKKYLLSVKMFIYLQCITYSTAGNPATGVAGIFLPVNSIRRFRTPVWSVNAPTAVEWCYATGQTGTVSFRLIFKQKGLWGGIVIVSLRVKGEVRLR